MHLLSVTPGEIVGENEAVDLGQSPADCVVLSMADSDLAILAQSYNQNKPNISLRLANLQSLRHNFSVDVYLDKTLRHSRLIIVRLLGGRSYWDYGVEQLLTLRDKGPQLIFLPGDSRPDPAVLQLSTLDAEISEKFWLYLAEGGERNAAHFMSLAEKVITNTAMDTGLIPPPIPSPTAGLYWPKQGQTHLADVRLKWPDNVGCVPIVFYRSLFISGDLAPIDALISALQEIGLAPLPIFITSLKDKNSADLLCGLWQEAPPDVILNLTAFAAGTVGSDGSDTPLAAANCPVIQTILSGETQEQWQSQMRGLSPRDLAMNVALPEVDGRIIGRAISFKAMPKPDPLLEYAAVRHIPVMERCRWTARHAHSWSVLRRTPPEKRRVALILANYPNRDGRLANGVGLDAPASLGRIITAMKDAGYDFGKAPTDGASLMDIIRAAPTNVPPETCGHLRAGGVLWPLETYKRAFETLPEAVQNAVSKRWGEPEDDPFVSVQTNSQNHQAQNHQAKNHQAKNYQAQNHQDRVIHLAIHSFGRSVVVLQPGRGTHSDAEASYHDPELPPPHRYVATYLWLQQKMHASVHLGKHGTVEWLPGKALALSKTCIPDVLSGHMPHLYPFIVNDPGEGSQAKRRTQAVIVDHLTPPLTRAESYGDMLRIESLADEYYLAVGMDPARAARLGEEIIALSESCGLSDDLGLSGHTKTEEALSQIDTWLCELKELQIRDGLHIFGESPTGRLKTDLLVALTRLPRGNGTGANASLIRAIAVDLELEFDPLDCDLGAQHQGVCPAVLEDYGTGHWRSLGDTVERLEEFAADLVSGKKITDLHLVQTRKVVEGIHSHLAPIIDSCGPREVAGLLAGLNGEFVLSGPSGAPSRGRPDVLPTGRNFHSVDSRAVPTRTAWEIGWRSATLLLERHFQDHGEWPKTLIMSAWGTANMRTGGDDVAQALAFMGVRPDWEEMSGRVTGFEILPLSVLGRPRVDITFRASGFFRDAFPTQMDLLDSAVRAVAALDETDTENPLAGQVRRDLGSTTEESREKLGESPQAARIFSSRPGSYGTGLQILMDEDLWEGEADLASAYADWGGYAYGGGMNGKEAREAFRQRLTKAEIVVHTQDNREHDVLDSDDYYQFQGGATAAVRHFSGNQPHVYHVDSSRPHRPEPRTLREEISRSVRGRAANPKWIAGIMRHGYKGAFEIAATLDYLYAFAATSREVQDHHFQQLFDAWIESDEVRDFMEDVNPDALGETLKRFQDAIDRDLWQPRRNSTPERLRDHIKSFKQRYKAK